MRPDKTRWKGGDWGFIKDEEIGAGGFLKYEWLPECRNRRQGEINCVPTEGGMRKAEGGSLFYRE